MWNEVFSATYFNAIFTEFLSQGEKKNTEGWSLISKAQV